MLAGEAGEGRLTSRPKWGWERGRRGWARGMRAIGCHAQHLASFTSGDCIREVSADVTSVVPGREVIDYVAANLKMESGARGQFERLRHRTDSAGSFGVNRPVVKPCAGVVAVAFRGGVLNRLGNLHVASQSPAVFPSVFPAMKSRSAPSTLLLALVFPLTCPCIPGIPCTADSTRRRGNPT